MKTRKKEALETRIAAAELAYSRVHPNHIANTDEDRFRHNHDTDALHNTKVCGKASNLMSFTKGLPHNFETGLVENPDNFEKFVKAIDSGDLIDFRTVPLGDEENKHGAKCDSDALPWKSEKAKTGQIKRDNCGKIVRDKGGKVIKEPVNVRAWESQSAGLAFDLEGPDAQAVTMPPAPMLGSEELEAEMGEVYVQALLRDIPFSVYTPDISDSDLLTLDDSTSLDQEQINMAQDCVESLTSLDWFNGSINCCSLTNDEKSRKRTLSDLKTAFRGITKGDNIGPYISQFLLAGSPDISQAPEPITRHQKDGLISYGAITISQQVRTAKVGKDYLMHWDEWFDVQNGADLRGIESYETTPKDRFIYTPRDLATYVHYDALYEAYLNACLLLLSNKVPFDPGIPFQEADNLDHQQGFAHFGGPHILSLVTEVATRALKAVRFQKYNVHRRCRPEVIAARIEKCEELKDMAPELETMKNSLHNAGILPKIIAHTKGTTLLPMAFCEGSPMHPSYGAGHATVAGACVTILKAFFDDQHHLNITGEGADKAFISIKNGDKLGLVNVYDDKGKLTKLTVEGELNKLASNISIGRNWAGVHYFSDYYESLLMGEKIAIGILEEQKLTYRENFSMTIPLFGGGSRRI